MSAVSPRAADFVRKLVAYLVCGVGTVYLLRVLERVARGRQSWIDHELVIVLVLAAFMVVWVRAARPVRRPAGAPAPDPTVPRIPDQPDWSETSQQADPSQL